ncbi:MAG: glycoside hydrolase family 1 protein [Culicoidibacterales bacterium]
MKVTFPEGFLWGAATSGIQSEGGFEKSNPSIWELWYDKEPERFYQQIPCDVVCDTYHRYEEDARLMAEIGMNSFRTSIQWGRLIKNLETNEVDEKAVEFYNNYIDALLEQGVEPILGLYHFDMPAMLQETYGGFESKEVVEKFAQYAKICFELFGDRVKKWSTFNEPIVPVEGGYLYDFHYPNKKDARLAVLVSYNTILAHAKAVHAYREVGCSGEIGVVLNLTPSYTCDDQPQNKLAAYYADLFFNRSFLDPMVKGEFPQDLVDILKAANVLPTTTAEEMTTIKTATIDFMGVNYYVPRRVRARTTVYDLDYFTPEMFFEYYIEENARFNPFRDNNEIKPVAIYDIAQNIKENYGNIKWYLSEIGIAMDVVSEGAVQADGLIDDSFRIALLEEHLVELSKAISEGANCFGVHNWTFIDCWSWINSFKRRYGFYRLDLETQERQMKKSGVWHRELAKNNGFIYEG